MKAVITRDDVVGALAALKAAGKKATIQAIYTTLGNRGSLSTIVKLKAEIESEALKETDSPDGLKAFRDVWALAREEGRAQKTEELEDARETIEALGTENHRLEGELVALRERIGAIEAQRDAMLGDVARANEAALAARAAGEENARKLGEALAETVRLQATFMDNTSELTARCEEAEERAHKLEVQLARIRGNGHAKRGKPDGLSRKPGKQERGGK